MLKRFATVWTLFIAGCGPTDFSISIENGEPSWVYNATVAAIAFWEDHGASFTLTDNAGLRVRTGELKDDHLGECDCSLSPIIATITIDPELESSGDYNDTIKGCLVAHEMGHSMGMEHIESVDSLMFPYLSALHENRCEWSQADEDEFCRVQPQQCE